MIKNLKIALLAMAMVCGGAASAQQLPNANFDGTWVDCHPWEKGATVKAARGTQPTGWCMANTNGLGGLGPTTVGAKGENRSGGEGTSVIITNTPNPLSASVVVPGYMSLGTTWTTAKQAMNGYITEGTYDVGVFGGIAFTKRPDALRFYYKREHNVKDTNKSPTNLTEKASIIAYSWKGTWTQVEVPSNASAGTPLKVTMTDRLNNILGKDCLTGGAVTKSDDAELISQIEYYIEGDQTDWKLVTIPFEYETETAIPEKFNVIFSANDMFADRLMFGAYNQLCIDDVELVYYHSLTALSYDGKAIEGFAEDTYQYSLESEEYDPEKELTYTKTGVASTVSTSYDENTALLSICVKGDDDEETVYTIQFAKGSAVVDSNTYTEKLYTTTDGETGEPQTGTVVVETLNNGNINFTLKNFIINGVMPLGNIAIKDIEVAEDNTFTFQGGITIEAGDDGNYSEEEWLGPMLAMMGEMPLTLSGKFVGDDVVVSIDMDLSETLGQIVNVHFGYEYAKLKISDSGYATFCAPFEVTAPEGITAYTCVAVDESSELVLEEVPSAAIPANTPVVLAGSAGSFEYFGVAEPNDGYRYGLLTGVCEEMEAPVGSYVLQNLNGKVAFYKVADGGIVVPANRAYLSVPSSAKALTFNMGLPTSVNVLNSLVSGKAEIYNISGNKLNRLQKGVNIVNGVKVVVR